MGADARLCCAPTQAIAVPQPQRLCMAAIQRVDLSGFVAAQAAPMGAGGADVIRLKRDLYLRVIAAGAAQLTHDPGHVRGEAVGIALALKSQCTEEMMRAKRDARAHSAACLG